MPCHNDQGIFLVNSNASLLIIEIYLKWYFALIWYYSPLCSQACNGCWMSINLGWSVHYKWNIQIAMPIYANSHVLQWNHMSIMASQITGNSTINSTISSCWQHWEPQNHPLLTLCEGNPLVTSQFPVNRGSSEESTFMTSSCQVNIHPDIYFFIVALFYSIYTKCFSDLLYTIHYTCLYSLFFTHMSIAWQLTHWGRATHICFSKLTIIGSDTGLSPGRRQAIIWTNTGILLIGTLGTNFSEILSKICAFHSRKCIWICRLRNGTHFVSASMCQVDLTMSW